MNLLRTSKRDLPFRCSRSVFASPESVFGRRRERRATGFFDRAKRDRCDGSFDPWKFADFREQVAQALRGIDADLQQVTIFASDVVALKNVWLRAKKIFHRVFVLAARGIHYTDERE